MGADMGILKKWFIILFVIVTSACGLFDVFDDDYLEEVIIPRYAFELKGNQIVFSPDGYGGLSSVEYSFISEEDVIGNNSDNVSYSGISWDFEVIDENSSKIIFNYESGGREEYILYNKYSPEGYSKEYYYEYTGYSGYSTYTYDGSWDYPDLGLQHDEALITLYVKETNWDVITLTIDGVQQVRMTTFPDAFIVKYPLHTEIDIDLDFTASGSTPKHRDFICDVNSYGWWAKIEGNSIRVYPASSVVE
jgi:hypothetical protein